MKKNSIFKTIMTILTTSVITVIITLLFLYGRSITTETGEKTIGNALKSDNLSAKLSLIKSQIDKAFYGSADENNLEDYAVKGYVAGLNDVYSEYFTANEMQSFTEETEGSYVGIGIYLTKNTTDNQIVIYGTMKGSPAESAGLQAGDVITAVDGIQCTGDDYDTITTKIKGKESTKVKLTILRNNETKEFEVERKSIEVPRVTSEMLDNKIGYIYLESFDGENVATQFKTEYESLAKQGATTLILDLRNDGGGIVDEATEIGDLFTDKDQTLLIEKDKNGKEVTTKAKNAKEINMKVVVLVNGYSASASEILTGIIKDDVSGATIIGTKTYGKGVIQSLYQLTDGSGLKLTTNEYFTPNHTKINGVGITPDVVVDNYTFTGKLDKTNDTQLKKAIEVLTNNK